MLRLFDVFARPTSGLSFALRLWITTALAMRPPMQSTTRAGRFQSYFGVASITMPARAFGSGGSSLSLAGMLLTANMCAMASMLC
jgi:hypothetical protein